jgi:hypothetical protein
MCASPGQAGRVKIARRFSGEKEICEKKQDFEARRTTETLRKYRETSSKTIHKTSPQRPQIAQRARREELDLDRRIDLKFDDEDLRERYDFKAPRSTVKAQGF